jgi:hypothetical protein
LELVFTSTNNTVIKELKAVYLVEFSLKEGIPTQKNRQAFRNVKCTKPNHFILKDVKKGLFTGLIEVDNEGSTVNIGIDSIRVKAGKNQLSRQVNLGTLILK